MKNEFEPRLRRSQGDYSLPFKLVVVSEVGRGEPSYKEARRGYGILGRSTVLSWCLLVDQAVRLYNEERPHLSLSYLTPNQVHSQAKSPAGKSERGPCLISVNV